MNDGKTSVLGPNKDRLKTDLRLRPAVNDAVMEACEALGVPKNAFFTFGATLLAVQVAQVVVGGATAGKTRRNIIKLLERLLGEAHEVLETIRAEA